MSFTPICPYIPPYTLYWQVNNSQSKLLTRMHPPPACFLRPHPIPLPDFSCTFALLIRIPLKILHQLPLSTLLPPAHLLLSGPMRTPVKLPISKQLHLLRIEGLSLLARGIFVVLFVKSMERDGLQLGLQDLYAPGLTSSQSLRLLPLRLGFVTGIQLQALLIVEDQCLEGHLGSGLVGLVEDDGPTVLQTHPNNFISLPSQNISRGDTPVVYYTYSPTPIIFSRPVLYNKIKMRREKHLLGMALLIVLVVMGSCETMGNSPYPSYSQVAAIGNGPDMAALGVGSVGIGAESNNTASLPYDSKALDDLSRMINELLASMNNTDPPSNPSSPPIQDNGSSGQDTPATPNTPPPQNTPPPTTNKPDAKPDSSPRPATTGTSSSQSGNTKSGSASGSTGTTSSVNTSGSNKGGASVSSPSSTSIPSSSSSSVKSSDNSGKTTSSSQATTTSSATITTNNKNTQTTTTTTSSSTNKNSNSKPISTPPSTPPPATTPLTPPPASDPTPSTSDTPATLAKPNSSSSSSTDPLFSFQDYLSTIFSPVNTDSATKSTNGDLNFGYSDGNTPVSDGSASSSDSTNANTDTSTSADTNTDTNSQAQTQTQTAPPPKDPPAAPTPAPASTNTKSTNTKKTDTKTSPTQITTSNLSTTPPSSPPSSSPPSSSSPSSTDTSPPPSSSRPSGLCVSDEQCRNDYGSFVADGLTLSCSPTLGVCTYS